MIDNAFLKAENALNSAIDKNELKKIVFSQSTDPKVKKAVVTLVRKDEKILLKIESFTADNKALTELIDLDSGKAALLSLMQGFFRQTNIFTLTHEHQLKISKKGTSAVFSSRMLLISVRKTENVQNDLEIKGVNEKKNYIIDAAKYPDFYKGLGVCDEKGRVFDKKQSKYRQINRFVEILDDSYEKLPKDGELTVCDLCCGKSYLTFAVYFYLTAIKNRKVRMYGVDLKADCIEFCRELAKRLGFDGLEFICMDIAKFKVEKGAYIDLVVSLHACDIATDIVLAYAVKNKARMILSTPCCHHEAFSQMKTDGLEFLERHSILKQKFCDAATDSLRALRLESEGYNTVAMELIDPEDTPKNVLIKAFYNEKMPIMKRKLAYGQYKAAKELLGLDPMLDKLLTQEN